MFWSPEVRRGRNDYLAGSGISDTLLSGSLVLGLSLLQEGLGNENVLKGGGGAVDESKIKKKNSRY